MSIPDDVREVMERLAEPFDPECVEFLPQSAGNNSAIALAYVDARQIMDRLDEVLGVGGWSSHHREVATGVVCKITASICGRTVEHEDIGSLSAQKDTGDQWKAAYSDSLKRCAVRLGPARYLYSLPVQWAPYDPQKRKFTSAPVLPDWAMPWRLRPEFAACRKALETVGTPEQLIKYQSTYRTRGWPIAVVRDLDVIVERRTRELANTKA